MLFKEIPFLRIVIFLCCGVITGAWFRPGFDLPLTVAVIAIFLIITDALLIRSRNNILTGIAINTAFFIGGILLYTTRQDSLSTLSREKSVFLCTLSGYPVEKEKSTLLEVRLVCRKDTEKCVPLTGSMIIYGRKDTSLLSYIPGDLLMIRCTPLLITSRKNPYEFNYRLYMENRGIRYYALAESGDIARTGLPPDRNLRFRALIIRRGIINMYRRLGITEEKLAVVAAITLGQKNLLDEEQKQDFATAGVIHVMAVSGLHVMILSLFVMNILFFLKRRYNIARIFLTLVIMWIFAFITGLTTSVVRASFMFTFIWSGYLLKRKLNPLNSLMASAFILIILRPGVIFDTGFLLSYSAVTFILVFYHDLYMTLHFKNRITDRLWQMTVVALVAQAGTMPLTITVFNRFPTYFLLSNLIIVPMASVIVITGCLIPLVYPVIPVAKILARFLDRFTGLTMLITEKTAALPWSSVNNAGMTPVECFLLMTTIFLWSYLLLKKRAIPAVYPLLSLLLLASYHTFSDLHVRMTGEIIVYNVPGSVSIGIRTGKVLNLYSDNPEPADVVHRQCSTLHLRLHRYPLDEDPKVLVAGENKILIVKPGDKVHLDDVNPDIIILRGKNSLIFYDLTGSPAEGATEIPSPGSFTGFPGGGNDHSFTGSVHSVGKSGAFIKSI